jgi:hypothetical protein
MSRMCLVILGVLCAGATTCEPASSGDLVASLDVTATLQENQCGQEAVPADETMRFDADVRRDGSTAQWIRAGAAALHGSVTGDDVYEFTTRAQQVLIEPEPDWAIEGCIVDEVQTTQLRLDIEAAPDAGVASDGGTADAGPVTVPATMEGVHEVVITPVPGSYCVPMLNVAGGPFVALPCTVRFLLEGEGTAPR